jgi:hypothetical protein
MSIVVVLNALSLLRHKSHIGFYITETVHFRHGLTHTNQRTVEKYMSDFISNYFIIIIINCKVLGIVPYL